MQLVERGKLALDAPASQLAPALAKAQVLEGFDAAGQPRLRAPKRPITLRHLLTHTAGFGRSEEHTSELQSQSNIVCRLLLEKKKNKSVAGMTYEVLRHKHTVVDGRRMTSND